MTKGRAQPIVRSCPYQYQETVAITYNSRNSMLENWSLSVIIIPSVLVCAILELRTSAYAVNTKTCPMWSNTVLPSYCTEWMETRKVRHQTPTLFFLPNTVPRSCCIILWKSVQNFHSSALGDANTILQLNLLFHSSAVLFWKMYATFKAHKLLKTDTLTLLCSR